MKSSSDDLSMTPRVTLPKLFEWYSEDFGGKDKVLFWLLGVLPEEQREDLRLLIEAQYDASPVLASPPSPRTAAEASRAEAKPEASAEKKVVALEEAEEGVRNRRASVDTMNREAAAAGEHESSSASGAQAVALLAD